MEYAGRANIPDEDMERVVGSDTRALLPRYARNNLDRALEVFQQDPEKYSSLGGDVSLDVSQNPAKRRRMGAWLPTVQGTSRKTHHTAPLNKPFEQSPAGHWARWNGDGSILKQQDTAWQIRGT